MCSVHDIDEPAVYTSCSGSFRATGLLDGHRYEFAVIATDGVGNVGGPYIYQWIVGQWLYVITTR